MKILPVIKAPIAVQLNRIAFAFYTAVFGYYLQMAQRGGSVQGAAIFLGMIFLSVLGLFYSCVRARRSRWIMSMLALLIPGLVITSLCLLEFSRPEGWWDWLMSAMVVVVCWLGVPILLALSLFKNINVSFGRIQSGESLDLVVEFGPALKSAAYFTKANPNAAASLRD